MRFGKLEFGILGFGILEIGIREIGIRDIGVRNIGHFGKMSYSGYWNSGKRLREKVYSGKWLSGNCRIRIWGLWGVGEMVYNKLHHKDLNHRMILKVFSNHRY